MAFPPDTTYALPTELAPMVSMKTPLSTEDTALLQRYLNSAAYIVDYVTRKPVRGYEAYSASASETRIFDDPLTDSIEIDDLVGAPTLVQRGTITINPTYYKMWPYNPGDGPYTKIMLRLDVVINATAVQTSLWYNHPFKKVGVGQIAVTGTWGYCLANKRPAVVKEAVLTQAERMYERMGLKARDLANAVRDPWKKIDPLVLDMLDAAGLMKSEETPSFA